jgi:hypothetical protein
MNGVDFSRWAAREYIRINTVEHGYNDISLIDTSYAAADVLLYQFISHCLPLHCTPRLENRSFITTQNIF